MVSPKRFSSQISLLSIDMITFQVGQVAPPGDAQNMAK